MRLLLAFVFILLIPACGVTPQPAAPHQITYKVETSDRAPVSLTYANETGATVQEDTTSPWSKSFTAPAGQFLYLSAQRDYSGSGKISCTITDGAKVIQTAESSGQYVIASCSGSVPFD